MIKYFLKRRYKMSTINERLRDLRVACNLTQKEFGEIIGLSWGSVCQIETGRRNVTERHLHQIEIWPKKKVNMKWLRTGEGTSMFLDDPLEKKILEFKAVFCQNNAQFNLFKNFLQLPPASRDIISNYLESCFGNRVPDQKEKLPTSTKELETLEKRYKPKKEENA